MGFIDKLLNPDKVSKYNDEHYIKLKHEAILHSIVLAAGMSPDCDEGVTYHQLEKVPCIIHQLKRDAEKPAQEYIPVRIKRQLEQYEKDDKELHGIIAELQDTGNKQKEEIEQLKERIKFLEETKEKIYLVKEFK